MEQQKQPTIIRQEEDCITYMVDAGTNGYSVLSEMLTMTVRSSNVTITRWNAENQPYSILLNKNDVAIIGSAFLLFEAEQEKAEKQRKEEYEKAEDEAHEKIIKLLDKDPQIKVLEEDQIDSTEYNVIIPNEWSSPSFAYNNVELLQQIKYAVDYLKNKY